MRKKKDLETNNVKIKMVRRWDGDEEEMLCQGKSGFVGGKRVISFIYDEEENGKNTHLLKISEGKMEWSKKGLSSTSTEFTPGVKVPFIFSTPYGNLEMENYTHSLDINPISDMELEVRVRYSLMQAGESVGEYDMKIYVYK